MSKNDVRIERTVPFTSIQPWKFNLSKARRIAAAIQNGTDIKPVHLQKLTPYPETFRICDGKHRAGAFLLLGRNGVRGKYSNQLLIEHNKEGEKQCPSHQTP